MHVYRREKYLAHIRSFYHDEGLIKVITGVRINYGPVLENVAYQYLRSLGYMVSVCRIGALECDFVARRAFGDYFYIQVAMTVADRAFEDREYRPFEKIRDSYPRYLFTLDPLLQCRDGVRHLNLMEFIADGGDLVGTE